jgi:hypothetical protein
VGTNGRIHQLRLDNNIWHPKELTLTPGAPPAFFEVRAYVYFAPSPATQHVVYLGKDNQGLLDNQVHELYADDSNDWHHNNLTTAVPGGAKLALTSDRVRISRITTCRLPRYRQSHLRALA